MFFFLLEDLFCRRESDFFNGLSNILDFTTQAEFRHRTFHGLNSLLTPKSDRHLISPYNINPE